jgi:hypothetical protein
MVLSGIDIGEKWEKYIGNHGLKGIGGKYFYL